MSELETLIAVAGTLGGVFLGSLLEERRENRRAARQVALRPLKDKEQALKDMYRAMADFISMASRIVRNPEIERAPLASLIDRLEESLFWAAIWLSEKNGDAIVDGLTGLIDMGRDLVKGANLTKQEKDKLWDYFAGAAKGIINDLGIEIAENQFQSITRSLEKARTFG